jgi:hypothetical protein
MLDQEIVYPKPTEDGYFYEDDTDEALNIETKTYENGRQVKRVVLSDKSIAIVRELNGAEMEGVSKAINKKEEGKYLMAVCMFATTINGGKVTMDELEQMRGRDYNRIRTACATINF